MQSEHQPAERVMSEEEDEKLGDLGIAEAASPISSRPPASANFEEMIRATAEGGGSSSNRWPRQETLALLQIRSEMDTAFRDATLKAPLWDQVSRFLEAIEKRERDRMIREEAWKRQDMARIAREHDLMAQEPAISASRDAAIIDFLQKLTGQTIQLPTAPPPRPQPPTSNPHQNVEVVVGSEIMVEDTCVDKAEERDGGEGPLWEEISAGMQQLGYKRSSKRCKEKWENINKYFKKVKESNKKRPQDAKTCPYFDELDALYQKKITTIAVQMKQQEHAHELQTNPFVGGGENQPEDMLNKGHQQIDNYSDEDDEEEDYEEVVETDEEINMVYKIQFQRQNGGTGTGKGTGTASSSFVAMVQ